MINDSKCLKVSDSRYDGWKVSDIFGETVYFEDHYFRIGLPLFINVKLSNLSRRVQTAEAASCVFTRVKVPTDNYFS